MVSIAITDRRSVKSIFGVSFGKSNSTVTRAREMPAAPGAFIPAIMERRNDDRGSVVAGKYLLTCPLSPPQHLLRAEERRVVKY